MVYNIDNIKQRRFLRCYIDHIEFLSKTSSGVYHLTKSAAMAAHLKNESFEVYKN